MTIPILDYLLYLQESLIPIYLISHYTKMSIMMKMEILSSYILPVFCEWLRLVKKVINTYYLH